MLGAELKDIHGNFNLVLSGNIMFTVATGPWNAECVRQFNREYIKLVSPLFGKQWSDLVILQGESLLIPEAEHLISQTVLESCQRGLSHVALIVSDSSVRAIARAQFMKIYPPSGLIVQFFEHQQPALEWLTLQGFFCDKTEINQALAKYFKLH
jgi:hypothetical protein